MAKGWISIEEQQKLADGLYREYKGVLGEDFQIISTIRYDPALTEVAPRTAKDIKKENFFLFPEHIHRLVYTSNFFLEGNGLDITETGIFDKLIEAMTSFKQVDKPLKVRLLLQLNGEVTIELYETQQRDLLAGLQDDTSDIWDVYIDDKPLICSPFTSFKTTHRPHYNDARKRCLPGKNPGKEEVIVVNHREFVMEGSITNIAVKKDEVWVTPQLASGCLCGVMRHFLLMRNYIKEDNIPKDHLKPGDEVLLFNGVMGVVRGRIVQ